MNLDRKLLAWAKPAIGWVVTTILVGYGSSGLAIPQAWLLSSIVAGVFLNGMDLAGVTPWLGGLMGVFAARAVCTWAQTAAGTAGAVRVKDRLRQELLAHLYELGPAYTHGKPTGELIAAAVQGIEALDGFYSQYLPQIALAVLVPATILIAVFPLDLLSGFVFLLTAPLIPIFMVLIGRAAEAVTRQQYTALGRMSAFFLDTLQGLATLKQLNQSEARVEQIAAVSERYRQKTMEVLRLTFLSALALELAATISTAVVAVEIGLRLLYGRIEFQPAFFILILAPEFYLPLRLLGQRFHAGAAGAAGARQVRAILDAPAAQQVRAGEMRPIAREWRPQTIQIEGLVYQYPGRSEPTLKGVDLILERGRATALVGVSGAGKSTLAHVLLGFLEAQAGQIRADGQNVSGLDSRDWRELVAWVPQQPYLFQDTLENNLRIARPEASQAELEEAARLAGLDEFIRALPEGYRTQVGEQGARLSSGQAQRLALARAFLKNAPVLILDEPTARLDPALQAELSEAAHRLCRDRIVLIIAHRLEALGWVERVAVLEGGRVTEFGAPDELRTRGGSFARLIEAAR